MLFGGDWHQESVTFAHLPGPSLKLMGFVGRPPASYGLESPKYQPFFEIRYGSPYVCYELVAL